MRMWCLWFLWNMYMFFCALIFWLCHYATIPGSCIFNHFLMTKINLDPTTTKHVIDNRTKYELCTYIYIMIIWMDWIYDNLFQYTMAGIIFWMRPANERWCYKITSSLIGRAMVAVILWHFSTDTPIVISFWKLHSMLLITRWIGTIHVLMPVNNHHILTENL